MKIGVIVAMSNELELMKPVLSATSTTTINGFEFYEGNVGEHHVALMKCGIGKVSAAVGALTLINQYTPDLIVNSGVAGGADASVNVMDVVVGEKVVYHDVWCGMDNTYGAVQGFPLYYLGDKNALSKIPVAKNIKKGLIASGDQFIDSKEKITAIKQNFPDALAVDMESGAIAQVCHLCNIPFLSMRIISDSPLANNNTMQYTNFWKDAPKQTFEIVKCILNQL